MENKTANDCFKILAFCGSIRKGSYNKMLLTAAKELAGNDLDIEIYDISNIPLYNDDIEQAGETEEVIAFKNKVTNADALLIASPEYNYSVSGVLKNAIDWASRPAGRSPLLKKLVAIMGGSTGMSGTIRAQSHLRQILSFSNMMDMKKPEVYVQRIQEKFNAEGILTDEELKNHLKKFIAAFKEWINLFNNHKSTS